MRASETPKNHRTNAPDSLHHFVRTGQATGQTGQTDVLLSIGKGLVGILHRTKHRTKQKNADVSVRSVSLGDGRTGQTPDKQPEGIEKVPKHLTFEQHLKIMQDHQQARGNMRQALIDVADNCHLGLAWFLDHDIEPTAADLLTFARMVLDREAQLDRRDDDELGALADDDT